MEKVGIGVIGVGNIGSLHVENLKKLEGLVKIIGICDIIEEKSLYYANITKSKAYTDYKKMLENKDIDAVLIATPTNTHHIISIDSIEAGKNIFCEKPVDISINKTIDILNKVKKNKVKFQVGFNRRYDYNFKKIKQMIDSGDIGKIYIIRKISRDTCYSEEYIKDSGGIFLDMTIHDFDLLRYLTGNEIAEVTVVGGVLVDKFFEEINDLDTLLITLKFKDGPIGCIDNCRKSIYGYDQRLEVFGSKGCAIAENDKLTDVISINENGIITDKLKYFYKERFLDSYREELRDFLNSILNNKEPSVSGIDFLRSMQAALSAMESYKNKKTVKINYDLY